MHTQLKDTLMYSTQEVLDKYDIPYSEDQLVDLMGRWCIQ